MITAQCHKAAPSPVLRRLIHSACDAIVKGAGQVARRNLEWLRRDTGATTLEFALSTLVLVTVVLGVMETGLALFSFEAICDSAREGSRYAMVRGNTCLLNGASCAVTPAQIQSYVRSLGFPGINGQSMTVTATYSAYPSGSTCTPNSNCANPGNLVTVTVQYPFAFNVPFVPARSLQLSSTSAMVISQ